MLSTCTTKDIQNIILRVASFSLSNIPDWPTHCLICNLDKPQSYFLDAKWSITLIATVDGICQLGKSTAKNRKIIKYLLVKIVIVVIIESYFSIARSLNSG